jgi:hypothetical protein
MMRQEADITINGAPLNDAESETIRVAIDTLANVSAEAIEARTRA